MTPSDYLGHVATGVICGALGGCGDANAPAKNDTPHNAPTNATIALELTVTFGVPTLLGGLGGKIASGARGAVAQSLLHFTTAEGGEGIAASGQLIGKSGIFALPGDAAARSPLAQVLLTGIPASKTAVSVVIPRAATGVFRRVIPVGPYTFLKALGGVRFAAPGIIDMSTGAFVQTGSVLVPYAAVYGPELVIYGSGATVYSGSSRFFNWLGGQ